MALIITKLPARQCSISAFARARLFWLREKRQPTGVTWPRASRLKDFRLQDRNHYRHRFAIVRCPFAAHWNRSCSLGHAIEDRVDAINGRICPFRVAFRPGFDFMEQFSQQIEDEKVSPRGFIFDPDRAAARGLHISLDEDLRK